MWKAGARALLAIAAAVVVSSAIGHLLGGGTRETRTALALSCGARNAGLALLVAALNRAPLAMSATVLAYLVVSAFIVIAYVLRRRRVVPTSIASRE